MAAATLVTGVLTQLDEFLDVLVPGFEVGADGALALAALVDRHGRVVDHLQEGHDTLRLAIGALDVSAERTHGGPVIAQAAGKLGQHGVVVDGAVNAAEIVRYRRQVAGRQLRAQRAGVEQRRRRRHEVEGRQQLVELDGAVFAVDLVNRQAHGHAHEERLRQLEARFVAVDEVAVVKRLQTQEGELVVTVGQQGVADLVQVVLAQGRVHQLQIGCAVEVGLEVLAIQAAHFPMGGVGVGQVQEGHGLVPQVVQQQAGGDLGVVRLVFD